ncbi:MAG TPA: PepSY domain-containing protein [Arachnia sp.]|nr:PepSY domain-containing protein [Arachnia sp.]HMT84990.1 PepSY domain-containing protein [Arachnia sp.]
MSMPVRPLTRLALAAAATLAVAGCGSPSTGPAESPAAPPSATETSATPVETEAPPTSEAPEETPSPSIEDSTSPAENGAPTHTDDAARAAQGALAAVPGDVISIDREGRDLWSVEVRTVQGEGVELYVEASTGVVQRQQSQRLPAEARDSAPAVTAVEAIEIALGALPNSTVWEVDLDTKRGTVVWEILVRDGVRLTEFYIDAATGEILKQETSD